MRIASVVLACALTTAQAFVSPGPSASSGARPTTLLRETVDEDAVAVIEPSEGVDVEPSDSVAEQAREDVPKRAYSSISQERLDKLTAERPYPLFLAEKTLGLFESPSSMPSPMNAPPKEEVVVLGTGWGAAAFLKNIDTDKYDVTVISPRNYFVFTPMLAGM